MEITHAAFSALRVNCVIMNDCEIVEVFLLLWELCPLHPCAHKSWKSRIILINEMIITLLHTITLLAVSIHDFPQTLSAPNIFFTIFYLNYYNSFVGTIFMVRCVPKFFNLTFRWVWILDSNFNTEFKF